MVGLTKETRGTSPGGFTLVEVLAVVALLAVVTIIVIPSMRRSISNASATVCRQQLRSLHQALTAYRIDNNGWLPDVTPPVPGERVDPGSAAWYGRLLTRYVHNPSALVCPADPARLLIDIGAPLQRHPDPANASSYGLNDVIRAAGLTDLDRHEPARPAETILLADVGPDHPRALGDTLGNLGRTNGRLPWDDSFHPAVAGLTNSWLTDRHFGSINVLTIGGAVQQVYTVDMMEDRIRSYYGPCASGGCPLCKVYRIPHYSFAASRLFWWTGTIRPSD